MIQPLIDNSAIKAFAAERVNLPRDIAQEYRDQVKRLRERLEIHIAAHLGFALVKSIRSASENQNHAAT